MPQSQPGSNYAVSVLSRELVRLRVELGIREKHLPGKPDPLMAQRVREIEDALVFIEDRLV